MSTDYTQLFVGIDPAEISIYMSTSCCKTIKMNHFTYLRLTYEQRKEKDIFAEYLHGDPKMGKSFLMHNVNLMSVAKFKRKFVYFPVSHLKNHMWYVLLFIYKNILTKLNIFFVGKRITNQTIFLAICFDDICHDCF